MAERKDPVRRTKEETELLGLSNALRVVIHGAALIHSTNRRQHTRSSRNSESSSMTIPNRSFLFLNTFLAMTSVVMANPLLEQEIVTLKIPSPFVEMDAPTLKVPSPFVEMDADFLRLSIQAAELSDIVMVGGTVPNATVFNDEPDEVLTVKIDDICFASFRGTLITSPEDIAQNLALLLSTDVCYDGTCCPTRKGYRDAFLGVGYLSDFQAEMEDCRSSCCPDPYNCASDEYCEVVFTGFSQGGSAAQVATVIMQDMNPTTITFGQPTTMQFPCSPIDTGRYYRFVNTVNVDSLLYGPRLRYDAAPYVEVFGTVQSGRAFILGQDSAGVAYYKDRGAPVVDPLDFHVNFLEVHDMPSYIDRLETLLERGQFPVSLDGFDSGHPCTFDSECAAPEQCSLGYCSLYTAPPTPTPLPGRVGDECVFDIDCQPQNTCEGIAPVRVCVPKLALGFRCNEDGDCLSGVCATRFRNPRCV